MFQHGGTATPCGFRLSLITIVLDLLMYKNTSGMFHRGLGWAWADKEGGDTGNKQASSTLLTWFTNISSPISHFLELEISFGRDGKAERATGGRLESGRY